MKELRDIKLDLLFGNNNEIINLFNEITDGIEIVNTNVYNEDGLEFIYHKDGKWIFFQDVKNGKFWCSNARYWSLFTNKFDLSYEEIQNITKFLVEEALKREVNTTEIPNMCYRYKVEEALKREVNTPHTNIPYQMQMVEEALKREVTPIGNFYIEPNLVQEVLKKEVNTPNRGKWEGEWEVQEALKRDMDTPQSLKGFVESMVDEALKREIIEPLPRRTTSNHKVEEALEKEISTPTNGIYSKRKKIEEALLSTREWLEPLEKEISKPNNCDYRHENKVQETLEFINTEEALNKINYE